MIKWLIPLVLMLASCGGGNDGGLPEFSIQEMRDERPTIAHDQAIDEVPQHKIDAIDAAFFNTRECMGMPDRPPLVVVTQEPIAYRGHVYTALFVPPNMIYLHEDFGVEIRQPANHAIVHYLIYRKTGDQDLDHRYRRTYEKCANYPDH